MCTACVHLFHAVFAKTSAMQCACTCMCVYGCVVVWLCIVYVHEWECPCVCITVCMFVSRCLATKNFKANFRAWDGRGLLGGGPMMKGDQRLTN